MIDDLMTDALADAAHEAADPRAGEGLSELDAALAGDRPVVVLIPESAGASPLEPAERVRAQLGLEP